MRQLFITEHENWAWKCTEGSLHVHIFCEYFNGNVKSDSLDKKTKYQIFIVHENPPFASGAIVKNARMKNKRRKTCKILYFYLFVFLNVSTNIVQ